MTTLYTAPIRPTAPGVFAVDTETTLADFTGKLGWNGRTRISRYTPPDLVVVSIAGEGHTSVYAAAPGCQRIRELCDRPDVVLIFHNLSFDIPVLLKSDPSLFVPLIDVAGAGRLFDTKLDDLLLRIGTGAVRKQDALLVPRSLKDLAARFAGIRLDKGAERVTFGQYLRRERDIPQRHLEYAANDATATLFVHTTLRARMRAMADGYTGDYPVLPDAEKRFGLLGSATEARGAWALAWFEQFPLRVDVPAARAKLETYAAECARLEDQLVDAGLARRGPKSGKFSLGHKVLRARLREFAAERGIAPPLTDSELISLDAKFWKQHIPRTADGPLPLWLRFVRLRKLCSTYLCVYASSDVHYPSYLSLAARTTRTSARRPSVQQIPKHRDNLRALFVPRPGHVLIEADFKAAELVALAQVYHLLYGDSPLGSAIAAGEDPHVATATRVFADRWESASPEDRKTLRQYAKAINFGLPGGLGARRFAGYARDNFGLKVTDEEAAQIRRAALRADPTLRAYLSERTSPTAALTLAERNLLLTPGTLLNALQIDADGPEGPDPLTVLRRLIAWQRDPSSTAPIEEPIGFNRAYDLWRSDSRCPSGVIRGRCLYTEAHNFPFQALIAAAAKEALWNLMLHHHQFPEVFSPVAFVHDSILIEAPADAVEEASNLLHNAMLHGIRHACPDIPGDAELTGPMPNWAGKI